VEKFLGAKGLRSNLLSGVRKVVRYCMEVDFLDVEPIKKPHLSMGLVSNTLKWPKSGNLQVATYFGMDT
jgi:hypothetical protein